MSTIDEGYDGHSRVVSMSAKSYGGHPAELETLIVVLLNDLASSGSPSDTMSGVL